MKEKWFTHLEERLFDYFHNHEVPFKQDKEYAKEWLEKMRAYEDSPSKRLVIGELIGRLSEKNFNPRAIEITHVIKLAADRMNSDAMLIASELAQYSSFIDVKEFSKWLLNVALPHAKMMAYRE